MIFELPCRGAIFDMDGTLIESTYADYLAWQQLFKDYGKTFTYKQYLPYLGVRSKELIELFFHFKGEELEEAMNKKSYYLNELIQKNGIQMVPYAKNFLDELKTLHLPLALATSSRKDKTMMIIETLQLANYFNAIVTGDDVLHSKPQPDIFIKAAEQLHLSPAVCIVIEDAPKGITAAHNANMKCVAITATHSAEQLQEADKIISSYKNVHFQELCNSLHS